MTTPQPSPTSTPLHPPMTEPESTHTQRSIVAIYDLHTTAEAAIRQLQLEHFDMKAVSLVGKDFQSAEHALGFYTAGDRIMLAGGQGVLWVTVWAMLSGGAFFVVPGIGPFIAMGPLVSWLVGAIADASSNGTQPNAAAGAFGAALCNIGVPKLDITHYEDEVRNGKFILMVLSNTDTIARVESILRKLGSSQIQARPVEPRGVVHASQAANYITRDRVLKMLSDNEIAHVSTAETEPRLTDGDEYIDLEQLEQGVLRARVVPTPVGRVLPRKAVHDTTWTKIVAELTPVQTPA